MSVRRQSWWPPYFVAPREIHVSPLYLFHSIFVEPSNLVGGTTFSDKDISNTEKKEKTGWSTTFFRQLHVCEHIGYTCQRDKNGLWVVWPCAMACVVFGWNVWESYGKAWAINQCNQQPTTADRSHKSWRSNCAKPQLQMAPHGSIFFCHKESCWLDVQSWQLRSKSSSTFASQGLAWTVQHECMWFWYLSTNVCTEVRRKNLGKFMPVYAWMCLKIQNSRLMLRSKIKDQTFNAI